LVHVDEDTREDLSRRLRKIGGQLRGIEQMLADGRDYRELVTQVSAATKALDRLGFVLVAAGLRWCLEHPDEAAAAGYQPDEVQRLFLMLS
jgi:DNA-binding FrmR family transcriptional regulator